VFRKSRENSARKGKESILYRMSQVTKFLFEIFGLDAAISSFPLAKHTRIFSLAKNINDLLS
jgi:hypothetical protein